MTRFATKLWLSCLVAALMLATAIAVACLSKGQALPQIEISQVDATSYAGETPAALFKISNPSQQRVRYCVGPPDVERHGLWPQASLLGRSAAVLESGEFAIIMVKDPPRGETWRVPVITWPELTKAQGYVLTVKQNLAELLRSQSFYKGRVLWGEGCTNYSAVITK